MRSTLVKLSKWTLSFTPLRRYFFPYFAYNMTAAQLVLLCQHLARVRDVEGFVLEVGCSTGMTTVFLNNYMDALRIEKPYVAVDTFSGFTQEDVRHEVERRAVNSPLLGGFRSNSQRWFDLAMRMNGASRVRSIRADINGFDLRPLGGIAFCLLDVDLYRPTRNALPAIYRGLAPGGVVLVDDCDASSEHWNGADQAYKEFCRELALPERIESGIGILEKPAQPRISP